MRENTIDTPVLSSPLAAEMSASYAEFIAERPPGADEDVHMLASLVDHVIERCSSPGDLVFDPFAGFGTTLARAAALRRQALGVELLPERVAHVGRHIPHARIVEGDARELVRVIHHALSTSVQASINLIVTSPPYMTANHHEADPLTAYEENGGDYARYLRELGLVAAQCAQVIAPGGYVVWNVADIHYLGRTTPLINDCARVLGEHLSPAGVTEIRWDQYPHDLVRDALLVFQRVE